MKAFDPIPSWQGSPEVVVAVMPSEGAPGGDWEALGTGEASGVPPEKLVLLGFSGKAGQCLALPRADGPVLVLYGTGGSSSMDPAAVRDAAGSVSRAAGAATNVAFVLPPGGDTRSTAQAAVEGLLLARYEYTSTRAEPQATPLRRVTLLTGAGQQAEAEEGARKGATSARATALARDLANSPPSLFTAAVMAETAQRLGAECGFGAQVFGKRELQEMGCGGLLGVNAGSADEPRMIKLRYEPPGADPKTPRLTLVGKGIMYDSGGIALKPADAVHATMKNDMSGAGAILATMAVLRDLGCPTTVTGYLMCTDNMPSGTATKLGDVLTIRGGKTVEVINTDAEGRLVMADALVLADEEGCDAVVDIATLTGACLRALGAQIAGVFGDNETLVAQVLDCAERVDEPAWRLPLAHRYRAELDSDVADIKNMGGPNGAAIHAALFLREFTGGIPWAHIDIAGTAQNDAPSASWRTNGCTGYGARLLAELACTFRRA